MLITTEPTLTTYEQIIATGIKAFRDMGAALAAIRDGKLYRPEYPTFEAYCSQRWQLSRPRAYQIIDAAAVVSNLSTNGDKLPTNERQARELIGLDPEEQKIVWQVVKKTAPGDVVTAAHVKSVVNVFKEVLISSAIDNGQGESVKVHNLMTAAITEETYERMRRQQVYITGQSTPPSPETRLTRLTMTVTKLQELDVPVAERLEAARVARQLAERLARWADELEASSDLTHL